MAEKAAREICEAQSRWDRVTINRGLVLGPSLTTASKVRLDDDDEGLHRLLPGRGAPDLEFGVVDVRDVAWAHIAAAFAPGAHGRYIVNAGNITMLQIGKTLRRRFGHRYPFPLTKVPKPVFKPVAPVAGFTREFVEKNVGYPLAFDSSRSRDELGLTYRDPRTPCRSSSSR